MESQDVEVHEGEGDDVEAEDESNDSESDADSVVFTDIKAQDFHAILSVILESFLEVQAAGILFDQKYMRKIHRNIHFVFFTPMVKCDTEEGDMLCGKYKSRTKNVKHLCRYCHIPTDKADRYTESYKYKTQGEMEKLIKGQNFAQLQSISQHYLKNAWYKIRFSNKRGIHGATPSDKLHAVLLGIFKYVREFFSGWLVIVQLFPMTSTVWARFTASSSPTNPIDHLALPTSPKESKKESSWPKTTEEFC
jgi:hypothetical protein